MSKFEIILHVCETKSISATAEKFNYTQSAISQTVKNYEKELGMPLFIRTKNGMQLAPNTEGIVNSIRKICQEEKNISRTASRLTSLESGHIRIGSIQSISYHWLPDILRQFSIEYPNITFDITVAGSGKLQQNLDENKLDLIFVSNYNLSPNTDFYPLGSDELMLLTSRNHPLADEISVSIHDIANEHFISNVDKFDFEAGEVLSQAGIQPEIRFHLNDDFAVQKMVESGFGITILPQLLLYRTPFDVCIRPFTEHYKRILGVAAKKEATIYPATQKLLEYVKEWSID